MKKLLIISFVLLFISFGLIIYLELSKINIYEITNSGQKVENKNVYLNATFVAGTITDNYYVMFGDGVQYIVYIDDLKANKINRYLLDNPESFYHIEGITKLIPTNLEENGIKFVEEWLNHSHNHEGEEHLHNITLDDFHHYFGYVYLDTNQGFNYYKLLIYITGITGIILIFYIVNTKYHLI